MIPLPKRVNIDEVVENSYSDFHAKGVDYICLQRSKHETLKLYFFDGDVSKLPEVVFPHDHRYDFNTYVVSGVVENVSYLANHTVGKPFERYAYMTPLNNSRSGFVHRESVLLHEYKREPYSVGMNYRMLCEEIHTIKMRADNTVMFIIQGADRVPLYAPTNTYCKDSPPNLLGLYSRFTADGVIDRLRRFEEHTGYTFIQDGNHATAG